MDCMTIPEIFAMVSEYANYMTISFEDAAVYVGFGEVLEMVFSWNPETENFCYEGASA
jgi:hypothetical protein